MSTRDTVCLFYRQMYSVEITVEVFTAKSLSISDSLNHKFPLTQPYYLVAQLVECSPREQSAVGSITGRSQTQDLPT